MNRLEIRTEVENLIDDRSFTANVLNGYIDQCISYAGAQVDIPGLKRIDTVETVLSQNYAVLSGLTGGFSGKLRRVKDADGDGIYIFPKLELLMDEYSTMVEVGEVEAVALEGSTLWYQKIPAEVEILTCLYYQNPASLALDTSSPDDFPAHLHRQLFVYGTSWMVYNLIEDGIEGDKVNVKNNFYQSFDEENRHSGITKLREWLGKVKQHNISSSWKV